MKTSTVHHRFLQGSQVIVRISFSDYRLECDSSDVIVVDQQSNMFFGKFSIVEQVCIILQNNEK